MNVRRPRPPEGAPQKDLHCVRRILSRPAPLPQRGDGSLCISDTLGGPVRALHGPYVLSGGWWRREIHRSYHFAETASGRVLWVYRDEVRGRWFLHGFVE